MAEKHTLRSPAYDLCLTGDGHGHHIPGTPFVYSHGWKPLHTAKAQRVRKAAVLRQTQTTASKRHPIAKEVGPHTTPTLPGKVQLVDKHGVPTGNAQMIRHYRRVSTEMRMAMYRDNGLELHYQSSSTEELLTMWNDPNVPQSEKVHIREDIEKRQKILTLAATAIDRDLTDSAREAKRDRFRSFDERLHKHKYGKYVIRLRERMVRDGFLDKFEGLGKHLREHGKEYASHVLTGLAVAFILEPLAAHGATEFGGEAGRHLAEHVMSNLYAESFIAVSLAKPLAKALGPIFRPFEHHEHVKRAEKKVLREESKHDKIAQRRVRDLKRERFSDAPKRLSPDARFWSEEKRKQRKLVKQRQLEEALKSYKRYSEDREPVGGRG